MVLSRLFAPRPEKKAAASLYAAIVSQARHPRFYRDMGVSDGVDGRFDMIALHTILVLRRLKAKELRPLSQALFDTFFASMDDALREMGVGDMTIAKKVRAMSEAFYGRIAAYDSALDDASGDDALAIAVERNVLRSDASEPGAAARDLARYVRAQDSHLAAVSDEALTTGSVTFLSPEAVGAAA